MKAQVYQRDGRAGEEARRRSVWGSCAGWWLFLWWVLTAGTGRVVAEEPAKELTAEQRQELTQKAAKLNGQALQLYQQGRYDKARPLLEQALALQQQLYPKEQYAQGHPLLATSLNTLGFVLSAQGEYGRALQFYQGRAAAADAAPLVARRPGYCPRSRAELRAGLQRLVDLVGAGDRGSELALQSSCRV
jgi:tetratricopeptide (TPR) repeat protein